MPERLMRQRPRHRVTRHALRAALPTPRVVLDDAALDRRTIRLEQLAHRDEAELVEAAEGRQIGVGERMRALADGSDPSMFVNPRVVSRRSCLR